MEQHNWPRIVAVSRELLRVLKQTSAAIPPNPAESRTDSLQFSAVNHQVGSLWTHMYHLLTIDPRNPDGSHWRDESVADGLWLCYQEHHELRAAALRLWRFFSRTITPRFNEFGRWPTYNDAELAEFEATIDALDRATGDSQANDPPAANVAEQPSLEARALALLTDHPDWTDTRIAEALQCNRGSLYRLGKYKAARELLRRDGIESAARGSKADGRIEAWESDE